MLPSDVCGRAALQLCLVCGVHYNHGDVKRLDDSRQQTKQLKVEDEEVVTTRFWWWRNRFQFSKKERLSLPQKWALPWSLLPCPHMMVLSADDPPLTGRGVPCRAGIYPRYLTTWVLGYLGTAHDVVRVMRAQCPCVSQALRPETRDY